MDFSKCGCLAPGICKIFKRHMGVDPPDWEWCQRAITEDRKSFYDIISKSRKSHIDVLIERYEKLNYDNKWFYLYSLMYDDGFHPCQQSLINQQEKFDKIINLLDVNYDSNINDVEILCLGHSEYQFNQIQDRSFLKKVNLNTIDAGKYSGNEWAESRAFISQKDLFSNSAKIIGFVSASWNEKFDYHKIEHFDQLLSLKALANSKSEDNIVLCADVFCPCCWINSIDKTPSILDNFFKKNANKIGKKLLSMLGLDYNVHVRVPFGNQMIGHKRTINKYINFLIENSVFDQVDNFCKKYAIRFFKNNDNLIHSHYHNRRIPAYFMEMISCFWFANQKDMIYIPNVRRKTDWYKPSNAIARIKKWQQI